MLKLKLYKNSKEEFAQDFNEVIRFLEGIGINSAISLGMEEGGENFNILKDHLPNEFRRIHNEEDFNKFSDRLDYKFELQDRTNKDDRRERDLIKYIALCAIKDKNPNNLSLNNMVNKAFINLARTGNNLENRRQADKLAKNPNIMAIDTKIGRVSFSEKIRDLFFDLNKYIKKISHMVKKTITAISFNNKANNIMTPPPIPSFTPEEERQAKLAAVRRKTPPPIPSFTPEEERQAKLAAAKLGSLKDANKIKAQKLDAPINEGSKQR